MRRFLSFLIVCAFLVIPSSAHAAVEGAEDCPQMTHSIYRLYTAYFLREPDQAGFDYWVEAYATEPDVNLGMISDLFTSSQESINRYGHTTNEEFVSLVYANVMGREPDPVGFRHWVDSLDNGYPRGSVLLAFSESPEYVERTGTVQSQAGSLMWYGRGVTFQCGYGFDGPESIYGIDIPVGIETPYVDIFMLNWATPPVRAEGLFRVDGEEEHLFGPDVIDTDYLHYFYNVYIPPGATQLVLRNAVSTSPNMVNGSVFWSVVFYDHPHSDGRVGW